jgi:hypothetical protein
MAGTHISPGRLISGRTPRRSSPATAESKRSRPALGSDVTAAGCACAGIVVSADFIVRPGDRRSFVRSRGSRWHSKTRPLASPAPAAFPNPDPRARSGPDGIPYSAGALVDRAG